MSQTATLNLWVRNQYGYDSDCTPDYLCVAVLRHGWSAPEGVTLDASAGTLTGSGPAAWSAYRSLAEAVAESGHGAPADHEEAEAQAEAGPPRLVPTVIVGGREFGAPAALADIETWSEVLASLPALAARLAGLEPVGCWPVVAGREFPPETPRCVLADALEEAGRPAEAARVRDDLGEEVDDLLDWSAP